MLFSNQNYFLILICYVSECVCVFIFFAFLLLLELLSSVISFSFHFVFLSIFVLFVSLLANAFIWFCRLLVCGFLLAFILKNLMHKQCCVSMHFYADNYRVFMCACILHISDRCWCLSETFRLFRYPSLPFSFCFFAQLSNLSLLLFAFLPW